MNEIDWGPIPDLVKQLQRAAPLMARSPNWGQVVTDLGGPWDIYAQGPEIVSNDSPLWPESLPSRRKVFATHLASSGQASRFLNRFKNAFGDQEFFPSRPHRIDRPRLAASLAECHIWLGKKALQYLASAFSPFSFDVPVQSISVSQRALTWTMYVFTLERWGPAVAFMTAPPLYSYKLDHTAEPGDAIVLHMHVEMLLETITKRLKLDTPDSIAHRHAGGLRKSSFLKNYSALSSPEAGGAAAGWLNAINRLINASPLTQSVYLDLFEGTEQQPKQRAPVNLAAAQDWGNDFWMSQIARSLIGAMLSPTPVQERLDRAEEELRVIEARARRWAQRWTLFERKMDDYRGLKEARALRDELLQRKTAQYLRRLADLRGLLESNLYLHLRVLDMLVRHVITASMNDLVLEWKKALRTYENARVANMLFDESGACFKSFEHALFGQEFAEFRRTLSAEENQTLRECLTVLLDPNAQVHHAMLARQANVDERSARRLKNRYGDETICGIELPFEAPNNRGPAPAQIVTDWLIFITRHFPAQTTTIVLDPA